MASASTCWVLITRRRAILHMCCRLAMLRGHSQKCTLPSRVLKHKSKGEKKQKTELIFQRALNVVRWCKEAEGKNDEASLSKVRMCPGVV